MQTRELDEIDYKLMRSLLSGPKYLHMGKSPVGSIMKAFELESMGYFEMVENYIHLTEKGREAIRKYNEF